MPRHASRAGKAQLAAPKVGTGQIARVLVAVATAVLFVAAGCSSASPGPSHATATPVGDAKEIEAIRAVFGDKSPPLSATKSLTGHSLGAAGVQEAIYSLLMMNNGFICESANITELDPAFADMPIIRERKDNVKLGAVLSNSFGFGGTNASVVFKRLEA